MAENTHQHHEDPLLLQSLRCPRCDSSNTKFCYYNNYSLSQPRHFCKACKRYWTRGGTLRDVPVGGGCRKNKRVRRQTTSAAAETPAAAQSCNLSTNPIRLKFPVSTINSARAFSDNNNNSNNSRGPDANFEPQMNGFGIGGNDEFLHDGYKIGFVTNSAPAFHSLGNNHSSLSFGSSSFSNSTATMAMATLQQQKLFDFQMGDEIGSLQHVNHPPDCPLIWFDPTSMTGSSVPSLI